MTPIEQLEAITATQCSSGNWNYDAYMHGMANGLILALATVRQDAEDPQFLKAPDVWLKDTPAPAEASAVSDQP